MDFGKYYAGWTPMQLHRTDYCLVYQIGIYDCITGITRVDFFFPTDLKYSKKQTNKKTRKPTNIMYILWKLGHVELINLID